MQRKIYKSKYTYLFKSSSYRSSRLMRLNLVYSGLRCIALLNLKTCAKAQLVRQNQNDTKRFLERRCYRPPCEKEEKLIGFLLQRRSDKGTLSQSIAFRNPWQPRKPSTTSQCCDRVKRPSMTAALFQSQNGHAGFGEGEGVTEPE